MRRKCLYFCLYIFGFIPNQPKQLLGDLHICRVAYKTIVIDKLVHHNFFGVFLYLSPQFEVVSEDI